MMYGFVTLALAAVAAALPAPATSPNPAHVAERAIRDSYVQRYGDGSQGAGWPHVKSWGTWDELWAYNANLMKSTCGWNGYGAENSATEIANIKASIIKYADQTLVDKRLILAVVMQESKGCVRAPTSHNGVTNPGLMQSHNGAGTCAGKNPCPASMIDLMIKDGVVGTAHGDGLRGTLNKAIARVGSKTAQAYYIAARIYNSGSVDWANLNNGLGSTNCYASDISNRVQGWCLNGRCNL